MERTGTVYKIHHDIYIGLTKVWVALSDGGSYCVYMEDFHADIPFVVRGVKVRIVIIGEETFCYACRRGADDVAFDWRHEGF